jgi:hypothetical protein
MLSPAQCCAPAEQRTLSAMRPPFHTFLLSQHCKLHPARAGNSPKPAGGCLPVHKAMDYSSERSQRELRDLSEQIVIGWKINSLLQH